MNKKNFATMMICAFAFNTPVFANETSATDSKPTTGQKVESGYQKSKAAVKEGYEDSRDATKKAYRGAKDKACEMVNGKLECLPQETANSVRNGIDKVKDKANDKH